MALSGSISTGSSVYGSSLNPGTASLTNVVSTGTGTDDVSASIGVNTSGNTSTSGNLNAGSYTGIESITGLSGADANNYTFAGITGDLNVSKLALTGSITAANKVYDATTAATITGLTLAGVISGDIVSYVGDPATFSTKNVGTSKTVTGTGL